MKKVSLLSLFGLLAAAVSVPAMADINNSAIYIINNTPDTITVSQQKQEESIKEAARSGGKTKTKLVGQELIVQPGARTKVASLGRDQYLHTMDWGFRSIIYGKAYSKKTTLSFTTSKNGSNRFESEWVDRPGSGDVTSRLTYSFRSITPGEEAEDVNLPYIGNGFSVRSKFKFPYHDIEMVFDPNIKP
jgi:hypothetical protein